MPTYEAEPKHTFESRIYLLPALVGIGLISVLLRLWYLQIVRGEELSQQALRGRTISVPVPAPRGQIVDRNGVPLAVVKPAIALMVTPAALEKNPESTEALAKLTGLDLKGLQDDVKKNLFRKHLPFVEKVGLTEQEALRIEERRAFFPGVFVRVESVRFYPLGAVAAHIVGYVSSPNESDVERLREAGKETPNFVGKVGVERSYDDALLGVAGKESVDIDSRGKPMRPQTSAAPVPGSQVTLTISADLQRFSTSMMAGRKGGIVALDPASGEVLAMASGPTYDTNVFAERGPANEIQAILQNASQPMHNRAAGSSYAPGSTFKIVTLLTAAEAGVLSPSTTFVCNGSIRIGNRTFRCLGRHGRINYETAMQQSCNVFYASLAESMKRAQIAGMATRLGLGVKTGIDLPSERAGVIPTDEWIKARKLDWYPGDTINTAVGQGYVDATPLQMAQLISIVANRGTAYVPHLVRSITPPGANAKPEIAGRRVSKQVQIPGEWWDRLQRALIRVVEYGTATSARISGITVAGKTGSAEHNRKNSKSHSWFVAYAPAENPRIAIAVVVETAGHGGEVAAPIARKVIERYLRPPASTSALDASAGRLAER